MKKSITLVLVFFLALFYVQGQGVIGKWRTIDDETGNAKSIVEIYKESGEIHGKVIEILEEENKKRVCSNCSANDKDKPILGMIIIKRLKKVRNQYGKGEILDPKNGKLYKCYITLESNDKLKVRGFIGISLFGRTQYWYRVKD